MAATYPLSNIQKELLKIYSANIPEKDLLDIKRYLAKYFAAKAIDEADKIWDEKDYNNETMDEWLNADSKNYGNKSSH